jgi:hypothetical protein
MSASTNASNDWDEPSWPEYAADEIVPGLFQGGTEDSDVVWVGAPRRSGKGYPHDLVVTLYADANPVPWGVHEFRFGFYDSDLSDADAARVVELARLTHRRWAAGDRVLIRCQAGVNRSGLVTALVLMIAGHGPAEAIALIRARRSSHVLSNRHFERWLLKRAADQLALSADSQAA